MSLLSWLIPLTVGMGLTGLVSLLWSMRRGQLDDLEGAAERVLLDGSADAPLEAPLARRETI